MVTTKRRINKETDRFGGYGAEIAGSPLSEYDKIVDEPPTLGTASIVSDPAPAQDVRQSVGAPVYTTLDSVAAPVAKPAPAPMSAPAPAVAAPYVPPKKSEKKREREDILPTVKTRAYGNNVEENSEVEAEKPARRERRGLDSRTKILLCVYLAIALVLAIAVIATGVSIANTSSQADAIAGRIAQNQAIIAEQESTLRVLGDEDNIRGRATENGMVQANSPTINAKPAEEVDYPDATPRTNSFDEFCDWLSKILG